MKRSIDCIDCRKCGNVCTHSTLAIVGEIKTISELMEIIEEDRAFYDVSVGGVKKYEFPVAVIKHY